MQEEPKIIQDNGPTTPKETGPTFNRVARNQVVQALGSGDIDSALADFKSFKIPVEKIATAVISAITSELLKKNYSGAIKLFEGFNDGQEDSPVRVARYATAVRNAIKVALEDRDYESAGEIKQKFGIEVATIRTTLRNAASSDPSSLKSLSRLFGPF